MTAGNSANLIPFFLCPQQHDCLLLGHSQHDRFRLTIRRADFHFPTPRSVQRLLLDFTALLRVETVHSNVFTIPSPGSRLSVHFSQIETTASLWMNHLCFVVVAIPSTNTSMSRDRLTYSPYRRVVAMTAQTLLPIGTIVLTRTNDCNRLQLLWGYPICYLVRSPSIPDCSWTTLNEACSRNYGSGAWQKDPNGAAEMTATELVCRLECSWCVVARP